LIIKNPCGDNGPAGVPLPVGPAVTLELQSGLFLISLNILSFIITGFNRVITKYYQGWYARGGLGYGG